MPQSVEVVDPASPAHVLKPNADGSVNATTTPGAGTQPVSGAVTANQGTAAATPWLVNQAPTAGTPVAYRTAIAAADVCAQPGTVTCTAPGTAGGNLLNVAYTLGVIAGRTGYGRTPQTAGNTTVTPTANQRIRMAWASVANADFYDLYSGAAATPLWLGRVTEAQRAAGGLMDTLNTYTAGGVAGAIDIGVAGTGLSPSLQVQNTAYLPDRLADTPTALGAGKQIVDVDIEFTRTGDGAAGAVTVIPMLQNTVSGIWAQATAPQQLVFGGPTGVLDGQTQRLRVYNQGQLVQVPVASIAGTGAAVSMWEIPS